MTGSAGISRKAACAVFLLFAAVLLAVAPVEASLPKTIGADRSALGALAAPLEPLGAPLGAAEASSSSAYDRRFGFASDLSVWKSGSVGQSACLSGFESRGCEIIYANNNPLAFVDPDGLKPKPVAWALTLASDGFNWLRRRVFSRKQAVSARKAGTGANVKLAGGPKLEQAFKFEDEAYPGEKHLAHLKGHPIKDAEGNVIGQGGRHVQTEGRTGHTFFSFLLGMTWLGWLSDAQEAAEAVGQVAGAGADALQAQAQQGAVGKHQSDLQVALEMTEDSRDGEGVPVIGRVCDEDGCHPAFGVPTKKKD